MSLDASRSHKWTGQQVGGNPADVCGMEDTCEDPFPPCPGDDEPEPSDDGRRAERAA